MNEIKAVVHDCKTARSVLRFGLFCRLKRAVLARDSAHFAWRLMRMCKLLKINTLQNILHGVLSRSCRCTAVWATIWYACISHAHTHKP